jgi:hypothetical protein
MCDLQTGLALSTITDHPARTEAGYSRSAKARSFIEKLSKAIHDKRERVELDPPDKDGEGRAG